MKLRTTDSPYPKGFKDRASGTELPAVALTMLATA